jgi:hypothetical protein
LFALLLFANCYFFSLCRLYFTVAFRFLLSSWEQFPATAWAAPSFDISQNIYETKNGQTIAAGASTLVKLCPYDEEEPAIWFRLI